ncbi:hypothetical protein Tco_0293927, partial [Tanacetum coccineum]
MIVYKKPRVGFDWSVIESRARVLLGLCGFNCRLVQKKDDGLGSFLSLSKEFGGQTPTSLAANIHDFESQMLEEKLVLVGDDGKPLKPSHDASNIDDIGGTLNDANKDRNKTQGNFRVLTKSASSECEVVIPRSSVEE